eukprot:CAMPEP_0113844284 /NCGR_PEP_ID=MMETSP0372-20130328/160_1 /TAXON_ID=340204 /ORGANISM="Lankesteria abbotti" /LENGTH=393 /DNA_ID=CAMNT_0000813287 /DNA_START=2086 /DNA_END=3267 /DNA_ORIENTATION=+ /assembly_acc=CAM_ASM_000359
MTSRKKSWRKINVDDQIEFAHEEELRKKVAEQDDLIVLDKVGRTRKELLKKQKVAEDWGSVSSGQRRLVDRAQKRLRSSTPVLRGPDIFDLWGDGVDMSESRKRNGPSGPRTLAPALKLPHPGQSVNPDAESHLALIEAEAAKVIEQQKVEADGEASMKPITMQLIAAAKDVDNMTFAERQQALNKIQGIEPISMEDNIDEDSVLRKKMPIKKTKGQRNKAARHAARVEKTRAKREARQFLHNVGGAKAILKELKKEDLNREQRLIYRRALKAQRLEEQKKGIVSFKTGKNCFRENPESVMLSDQLRLSGGSLRKSPMMLEASAVSDRAKSVQRRGLIELPMERTTESMATGVEIRRKVIRSKKHIHKLMREAQRDAGQRVAKSGGGRMIIDN